LRTEWSEAADVLTCAYRFVGTETLPQQFDAAATLLALWPGLAVLRARGSIKFTLGACTALRGEAVRALGGWARFADELAEDYRLGEALATAGQRIRLSENVIALESDPLSWRDYWRHQRRVAVTYRVANPAGFAGMLAVQGIPASLLFAALFTSKWDGASWLVFGVVFSVRWWTVPWIPFSMLVASMVETVCWFGAWLAPTVFWAGRKWRINSRGKLLPTQ
jgi:ceramide glucosyltransferase